MATIRLDHLDNEAVQVLQFLHEKYGLFQRIVAGVAEVVPDTGIWRITLTGDVSATVNRIESRSEGESYTTDRGAGQVGGRTVAHRDGMFDIVIWADVLISDDDASDLESIVGYALTAGAHIAAHEAGHIALSLREESGDFYQDLPNLPPTEYSWRKPIACHMDDYRIECMTARVAPSPDSYVAYLDDALNFMRISLSQAAQTWRKDIESAYWLSLQAVNGVIRCIAYLLVQLTSPLDEKEFSKLDGWSNYLEPFWKRWEAAFGVLLPADQRMTRADLNAALENLCALTCEWVMEIGIFQNVDQDGTPYMAWKKQQY
jgi:hypothetical protein